MQKATTPTMSIAGTPVAERPLAHLFYYGPDDPQADLSEALRGVKSLLRAMFAAIDEETDEFRLEDKDISELLFITSTLVDKATTAADTWSEYDAQAREELQKRADKLVGDDELCSKCRLITDQKLVNPQ